MKIPRILLAAPASGSGKTLITCGILTALKGKGLRPAAFKCGPDYIDPMFHRQVIGTASGNLDTFFTSPERTRYLLARGTAGSDLAVMEGVMGYYDGVGGNTDRASSYDLARVTDTPVILIVNARGMSLSLVPLVKGFLEYRPDSRIRGVILNQCSPSLYPRMKTLLEEQLPVKVLGYVPRVDECRIESRHLGLWMPEEVPDLKKKLLTLAGILEKSLDLGGILALAYSAPDLPVQEETFPGQAENLRIGLASDEAFGFFYLENFSLLGEMGAELVPFSPIHDRELPPDLDGLLLYGGYPELKAAELAENISMRESIQKALEGGMPCMAECGGYLYLQKSLEGMDGKDYPMVGILPGRGFRTPRLNRFGYVTLRRNPGEGNLPDWGEIPAHEFHYFDSTFTPSAFHAVKPGGGREWDCMSDDGKILAGFPHLYYYGNPEVAVGFLKRCEAYRKGGKRDEIQARAGHAAGVRL